MAQEENTPMYLHCSGCVKKYINDDEHVKQDFGYDRLGRRYKSCAQCHERYERHRESHKEERRETAKQYYEENKDIILDKRKSTERRTQNT